MTPDVSVVIATFKRPALLLKCLECLNLQYNINPNFEVIVISDGPDEATTQALTAWKANNELKLIYAALDEKKGPAAARNAGWRLAVGSLIAFTDDDCLPGLNWVDAYYNAWLTNPSCAFSGTTKVPVGLNPTDYEKNISGLATAAFITANCCCPKDILKAIDGFDERFTMAWREDSDLEFKLSRANVPVLKISEAVVVHPVRSAYWGVSLKDQKKTLFNSLLFKKYPILYREHIQAYPPFSYYIMVLAFILLVTGLATKSLVISVTAFLLWAFFTGLFISKRLKGTSRAFAHVGEMILTSLLIPFLSLYWQWYGNIKFRVLLF